MKSPATLTEIRQTSNAIAVANVDILHETKRLLGNEGQNWTKHAAARLEDGKNVHYTHKKAVKFDLLGAAARARVNLRYTDEDVATSVLDELLFTIGSHVRRDGQLSGNSLTGYNDSSASYTPVLATINTTIARLQSA